MANRGIDWKKELVERSEKDHKYLAGVSVKSVFEVPKEFRHIYLPAGELQNIGEEKMDCVSRAVANWHETELTYAYRNNLLRKEDEAWLERHDYVNTDGDIELSDAYIAILSGTTRDGNSLKAPIDAARKHGMVPKRLLPQLDTFDSHHSPSRVTDEIKALGVEFTKRFPIGYEQVAELQFTLNDENLVCAGYAWPTPVDGIYPRVDLSPNHCFLRWTKELFHLALDNYKDRKGEFIKKLAPDFNFMDYGYRLYFKAVPKQELRGWRKLLMELGYTFGFL